MPWSSTNLLRSENFATRHVVTGVRDPIGGPTRPLDYSGRMPALRRSAATVAAMSSANAPGSVRRVLVRIAHIALSSGRAQSTVSPTYLFSSVVYSAKVSGADQYS